MIVAGGARAGDGTVGVVRWRSSSQVGPTGSGREIFGQQKGGADWGRGAKLERGRVSGSAVSEWQRRERLGERSDSRREARRLGLARGGVMSWQSSARPPISGAERRLERGVEVRYR